MSIFDNPRDVTFTIGGEKFKGVLTKGLEMTNKEKYIPKVGEKFKWNAQLLENGSGQGEVVYKTDKQIAFINEYNEIDVLHISTEFQPITTKADVEREQLIQIMKLNRYLENCFYETAIEMQKLSFTIPKKVKRSDVFQSIYSVPSSLLHQDIENVGNAICNLLGDLVENDQ